MNLFGTVSKSLSVVAFIAILAGCSSDSDDGAAGGGTSTQSGVFIDTFVAGLSYDCQPSALSGKTDAEGKYDYKAGDECTFSIADQELGKTAAKGVVTPLDFLTGSDGNRLVNILMLLQSLDSTGDLDDGIQIPEGLTGRVEVDITSSGEDIWEDALGDFLWIGNSIIGGVSADAALEHFYSSVGDYFQTVLTEEMFTDKQFILDDGLITFSIVEGEYNYQLSLYGDNAPCNGSWSVEGTGLNLLENSCTLPGNLGLVTNQPTVVDFNTAPAIGTVLRAKIGAGPYEYGFQRIKSADTISVPMAPSAASVVSADTTDTHTTVSWTDNSDNEAYFTVNYGVNAPFSLFSSSPTMGTNSATGSVTIGGVSGLQEGTEYSFRVIAVNAAGSSDMTEVQYFTTRLATPTNLAYTQPPMSNDATITWDDNSDHETGYAISMYDNEFLSGLPIGGVIAADSTSHTMPDASNKYIVIHAVGENGNVSANSVTLHITQQ